VNPISTTKLAGLKLARKEEDAANLLDEHSARNDQNGPHITATGL
jgi:hypothetical protein